MEEAALPWSYKVKRARVELNATFDIQKIDGFEGAFRSMECTLVQQVAALVGLKSFFGRVIN